jgi:hypothetical protein
MASDYESTHQVNTGTDIYAVFNNKVMAPAQGVSYSVTRQKAPIYTLGSADARAVARSKRGIAGSMIMTTFDRHCLGSFIVEDGGAGEFYAKKDEMAYSDANPYELGNPLTLPSDGDVTPFTRDEIPKSVLAQDLADERAPMYADQILPFDVTLTGMNESGNGQAMRIYAVEFLNEGSGVSIDDTSNEVQLTYIARMMSPWIASAEYA